MNSEQRQKIVNGLAAAMVLIYEHPYDYQSGSGGTNYFQLGRAWGIFESMISLLPEGERNALLDEAKDQAGHSSNEAATQAFLQTHQSMAETFNTFLNGFKGED